MGEQSQRVLDRYQGDGAARRYARLHRGRARHLREADCLRRALRHIAPGARVLDLPCGTGRMLSTLTGLGFDVTAADGSEAMTRLALEEARQLPAVREIRVEDVFKTRFPERAFDAVVCNRLLHHFRISEDRRAALRELARISRGPVVASFFCSHSIEAARSRISRALGKPASERSSISYTTFCREMEDCGLRVLEAIPTLPLISQQWYVVGVPA